MTQDEALDAVEKMIMSQVSQIKKLAQICADVEQSGLVKQALGIALLTEAIAIFPAEPALSSFLVAAGRYVDTSRMAREIKERANG